MAVERTPNKSQLSKLTLEKKILPPLLRGFELATFRSRIQNAYQQVIPAPPVSRHFDKDLHAVRLADGSAPRWVNTGVTRKVLSAENSQLSKGLCFRTGLGQNIALHSLPAARNMDFQISAFPDHSASPPHLPLTPHPQSSSDITCRVSRITDQIFTRHLISSVARRYDLHG